MKLIALIIFELFSCGHLVAAQEHADKNFLDACKQVILFYEFGLNGHVSGKSPQAESLLNAMFQHIMRTNHLEDKSFCPIALDIEDQPIANGSYKIIDGREYKFIIIHSGFIKRLHDDSELAIAIGHELSHIKLRHDFDDDMLQKEIVKLKTDEIRRDWVKGVAFAFNGADEFKSFREALRIEPVLAWRYLKEKKRSENKNEQKIANLENQMAGVWLKDVEQFKDKWGAAQARQREMEADRLGLVYAARSGYDPDSVFGLMSIIDDIEKPGLSRLREDIKKKESSVTPDEYFNHPSPALRAQNAAKFLPALKKINSEAAPVNHLEQIKKLLETER